MEVGECSGMHLPILETSQDFLTGPSFIIYAPSLSWNNSSEKREVKHEVYGKWCLPFAIDVLLNFFIVWPLGASRFILGVYVVIDENADFMLKVRKIQCLLGHGGSGFASHHCSVHLGAGCQWWKLQDV